MTIEGVINLVIATVPGTHVWGEGFTPDKEEDMIRQDYCIHCEISYTSSIEKSTCSNNV